MLRNSMGNGNSSGLKEACFGGRLGRSNRIVLQSIGKGSVVFPSGPLDFFIAIMGKSGTSNDFSCTGFFRFDLSLSPQPDLRLCFKATTPGRSISSIG